jgi:hypothetical protein
MDCWDVLAISDEGKKRLKNCPGYEPAKAESFSRDCIHCGFDYWDHIEHEGLI